METTTFSLDVFHRRYAQSRGRWLDSHLRKVFEDIQKVVTEGSDQGWWETDEELKDRFGISRPMAQRIRSGNYDDLGSETIFGLASILGIPSCEPSLGAGGKRRQLLEDMLPLFLEMQWLEQAADIDAVDGLVEKLGHIDWESQIDGAAFRRWLANQEHKFPDYAAPTICAAGLWLVLRPKLQCYPDFLLRYGRIKLNSAAYQEFHADVEIIGKMRRAGLYSNRKCAKQLDKAHTAKGKAAILLEEMSTSLNHLNKGHRNPALGLLLFYKLELDDLLTLSHGELLEKSERICDVSNTFFN